MNLKIASVFPGQGSQSMGMLGELAASYSQIETTFNAVSDHLGYDLWQITQQGPEEHLNQTQHTQVVMLTADVAVYRLLEQELGFKPVIMAGHSLGEYAALVCAGAISLLDAAKLVSERGRLMQEAVPFGAGAMAAIVGLSDEQVQQVCSEASQASEQVTPANYNAIGQVVIAGHTPAIERAILLAEGLGARLAKIIPVSVPCHCPLLTEAAERFRDCLQAISFTEPQIPVISNVDLSIYESPEQIRRLLKEQLYSPVRWVETIQIMKNKGIQQIIECGPGKVLSGLIKRIGNSLVTFNAADLGGLEKIKKEFFVVM